MKAKYLFELSWEVCNKVGGIYTVITSKLRFSQSAFEDNYYAIGPYIPGNPPQNFVEHEIPDELKEAAASLQASGVIIHFGTWVVNTEPKTILIDASGLYNQDNGFKFLFWERYQLDTLGSNFFDVDQPLIWAVAAGMLVQNFANCSKDTVALHCHEWLAAGALLYLGKDKPANLRTVFTTHATSLGRALASRGIYESDVNVVKDPEAKAREYNVLTKHQIERIAGSLADSFTAVSISTAKECEDLLKVKPMVVENGLDIRAFPDIVHLCGQHISTRQTLLDFIAAYFFPYYRFDLQKTRLHYTIGRYEFHNKGYDLHLEALGELNNKMVAENDPHTLVTLFMIPGDALRVRPDILKQLAIAGQINKAITQEARQSGHSQLNYYWDSNLTKNSTTSHNDSLETHAKVQTLVSLLPRVSQYPLSPYDLHQGDDDPIIKKAKEVGLLNRPEDKVKIIFLPAYFDGYDGLFNLPLYEIMVGCDLGIFASAYEPWGYTPMESLVVAVPAIVSMLAGFGQSAAEFPQNEPKGVTLFNRKLENREQDRQLLADLLYANLIEDERQLALRRISAFQFIQNYSWDNIFSKYLALYNAD